MLPNVCVSAPASSLCHSPQELIRRLYLGLRHVPPHAGGFLQFALADLWEILDQM